MFGRNRYFDRIDKYRAARESDIASSIEIGKARAREVPGLCEYYRWVRKLIAKHKLSWDKKEDVAKIDKLIETSRHEYREAIGCAPGICGDRLPEDVIRESRE